MMIFVALSDIEPGEEIAIDYDGQDWEQAWEEHKRASGNTQDFRHEIGTPEGLFPDAWKNNSVVYKLAQTELQLMPGELVPMTWKHHGKRICKHCHRIGLPSGFSQHMLEFAEECNIMDLYKTLLCDEILELRLTSGMSLRL